MDDGDSLLKAIIAQPEEDTPRLVYADWLDENGQPERAEFIRVQCELARYPRQANWLEQMPVEQWTGSAEEGALLRRLDPLVKRHTQLCKQHVRDCADWSAEFIRGVLGKNWLQRSATWQWGWTRGFIGSVTCTAADWLTHADAILAAHPVREVTLTTLPEFSISMLAGEGTETDWVRWSLGSRENPRKPHPVPYAVATGEDRDYAAHLLKAEWPGITFTLPPEPMGYHRSRATYATFREDILATVRRV